VCSPGFVCFDLATQSVADPLPDVDCYSYAPCAGLLPLLVSPTTTAAPDPVAPCTACDALCSSLTPQQAADQTSVGTLQCLGVCVGGIECFDLSSGLVKDPLPDLDCLDYDPCQVLLVLLSGPTTTAAPTTTEAAPTTTEAAPTTTEAAPTTTEAASTTEHVHEETESTTTTEDVAIGAGAAACAWVVAGFVVAVNMAHLV
jgi:hypothetical protein